MACNGKPYCGDIVNTCPPPWNANNDKIDCLIDNAVGEALNIAGAPINVFKLLGVKEQGLLVDLTGQGQPISNGENPNYPAINAFYDTLKEWRSTQTGSLVTSQSFIGYDFGPIKLNAIRQQYGIDTEITHHITSIKIKQGEQEKNRCTKVRIERSSDGQQWYGVAVLELPNNNSENFISFKQSAPSRYWRLRPIEFNGSSTDHWAVNTLQLIDYNETDISDVQDQIFLENRTRDYADTPIQMKAYYDLLDVQSELSRFGLELPSQIYFMEVHFATTVDKLGRPFVIGDIIEMPSETQYDRDMNPVLKYMEVTDVGWSTSGYTPGWRPTMLRLVLQPALAAEETQDIFGDLNHKKDSAGLMEIDESKFQSLFDISDSIGAEAKKQVPESGEDTSGLANIPNEQVSQQQIDNAKTIGIDLVKEININPRGIYIEDAMPQEDRPYTEGDQLPTNAKDGDYHRLTYSGLADNIPPRLFRFSTVKNRWIYLETDRRYKHNDMKPSIQKLLKDKDAKPTSKIIK